jgi:peptide-methionine (S)-S-oxide reductase
MPRRQSIILVAAIAVAVGYAWLRGGFVGIASSAAPSSSLPRAARQGLETATFAAGCFWCAESDFEKVPGVVSVVSGYSGGRVVNPTYAQVSHGGTGHAESVEVTFDPAVVTYEGLLDHFWRNVDPFVSHRQFCDVGDQYRPEIFVHDAAQRAAADASKRRMQQQFAAPILVRISDAGPFYPAESYHQDYYKTHPIQYRFYRWSCGRDARLASIWSAASASNARAGR